MEFDVVDSRAATAMFSKFSHPMALSKCAMWSSSCDKALHAACSRRKETFLTPTALQDTKVFALSVIADRKKGSFSEHMAILVEAGAKLDRDCQHTLHNRIAVTS